MLRFRNDRLNKKNREKLAAMSEDEKEKLRQQLAYADKTDRENPVGNIMPTNWSDLIDKATVLRLHTLRLGKSMLHRLWRWQSERTEVSLRRESLHPFPKPALL
jgi:hypothetical protein